MQHSLSEGSQTNPPNDVMQEDIHKRLLRSVREGSKQAFEKLWEMHFSNVVHSIRPLAHGDAEDIASEAFLATWEQLHMGLGPQQNFRAYVRAVAKNLARQDYRKYRENVTAIVPENLDALAPPARSPESLHLQAEQSEQVHAAFMNLPARWRDVLNLQHIEQVSRTEIGIQLGVSPNAVSALSRRARLGFKNSWLELEGIAR